jgi:uncharacterized peroxidase-related enzyme
MSAVKLVNRNEVDPVAAPVYAAVEQQYGFTPNILKAIANCPDLLVTFAPFWGAIYSSPVIGPRLRAITALATARAHDCNYCISHMSASALKAGMTPQEIDGTTPSADVLSDREQLAIEFADVLTRNASGVSDALLTRMKAAFTDPELVNIALVVGLYNLTGRFLKALRIDTEEALSGPHLLAHLGTIGAEHAGADRTL